MTNVFSDPSNQVFSRCAIAQSLANKSVVTLDDISTAQIRMLLDKARYIDEHRKEVARILDGRVLASLL